MRALGRWLAWLAAVTVVLLALVSLWTAVLRPHSPWAFAIGNGIAPLVTTFAVVAVSLLLAPAGRPLAVALAVAVVLAAYVAPNLGAAGGTAALVLSGGLGAWLAYRFVPTPPARREP